MSDDPIQRFHDVYQAAQEAARKVGLERADAMALATADASGRPSVRIVLLKEATPAGFTFYTNFDSRKGRELAENPRAALCFYWEVIGQQIRVEGPVARVSDEESDAYWASRPRGSQIGAWASHQSAPLESRDALLERVRSLPEQHAGAPVPRTPSWGGYRLTPERIEFWENRDDRLHVRTLYTRTDAGWTRELLQP